MASESAAGKLRYLIVSGPHADRPELIEALSKLAGVRIVESAEEALEVIRSHGCDLVICPATQIVPLARRVGHMRTENFLEEIGQGACVVDCEGAIIWANQRLKQYPESIVERIRQACVELCGEFSAEPTSSDPVRVRNRRLDVDQDYSFDLTVSARIGVDGTVEQVVALAWDVTETRRLQEKLDAIEAAGHQLVNWDPETLSHMDVTDRLEQLERGIVACCHDLLNYDNFVVRVLDKRTRRLDTILATGLSEEARDLVLYASTEGNGISGYVAATGQPCICRDTTRDPRYKPGLEGARSCLTVPLLLHDEVIGVFNVESRQPAAFDDTDLQFAEILARYIALALHMLELMAVERHATTDQLASDVEAELAGPLNDIVARVTRLMEDYRDNVTLRERLRSLLDDVDTIKGSLQAVTRPQGVTGLSRQPEERDELLTGKRVLIADDEDIIRDTIADVLTKAGAITCVADDGDQALAMIRSQRFDLVLSDIKMPNRDGYEVFAAVREVNPECPVVLITGFGYDPNHTIVRASREGLAGVLFKPFKVEQLLEEVRDALKSTVPE